MFKYLWKAYYADGSSIMQPQDDKHPLHDSSKTTNPNAFRYALDEVKQRGQIVAFTLKGPNGITGVELIEGRFAYNGKLIPTVLPPAGLQLNLLYYRNCHVDRINGLMTKPVIDSYVIGWETLADGKPIKQTITLR